MFRKTVTAVLAVMLILTYTTVAFAAESTGFTDVPADAWYAEAVQYCRENNLMDGTGNGAFSPDAPMTRAMLVTVLYRMADSPATEPGEEFQDVPAGTWYAAPVNWAAANHIVDGYGDGRDPVTREQTAAIVWRYAEKPTAEAGEDFVDEEDIADFAGEAVDWARANGIINGMPGNLFSPKTGTTRAQAAQILMGYDLLIKKPDETESKILVAYFSATNNTEGVAQKLADGLGADLYEITPEVPYISADLNYGSSGSRTSQEQNDPSARPAISGAVENMEQYDVVFIGYPIWWGEAPRIMSTFIESYDFSGKTLVAFCTSASSGFGRSDSALRSAASGATWLDGHRFSASASADDVMAWANGLGIN